MKSSPILSIVIPAHNEAQRLPTSLKKIVTFLESQSYTAEVVVVENGSKDRTVEVVEAFAKTHPYVRLMRVATRGKGLAVRAGMLAAKGDYRFICDADLSMPIDYLPRLMQQAQAGYDVVIGSREGTGAQRIGEPTRRHIIGRIANAIIQVCVLPGYHDTQCGFKLFSRRASEDLFNIQRVNGIGFDIELVFLAEKRGYRISEVPITWYYDPDSRIRLVDDSLHMLQEIWQIRCDWHKEVYQTSIKFNLMEKLRTIDAVVEHS